MWENEALLLSKNDLKASFIPAKGMNMVRFSKKNLSIIDPATAPLFEERFAGLGPLIGPHFHHRQEIPPVKNESLFPHIARVKAKGTAEPFSHGIGRYAPWTISSHSTSSLHAELKGSDLWHGVALRELEGQDFKMDYEVHLEENALVITLAVESEKPSVVGLHTYYALYGNASVRAHVQALYNDQGQFKEIPSSWLEKQTLQLSLERPYDFGFFPFPDKKGGLITLQDSCHSVQVQYECDNEENSWQLWRPLGTSFVCIEPLSARNPRLPVRCKSRIKIRIMVEEIIEG